MQVVNPDDIGMLQTRLVILRGRQIRDVDAVSQSKNRRFFTRLDPTDEEIARVVKMVGEMGGLDYARERADHYAGLALDALGGLGEGPAEDALRASIAYAIDRRR